MELIMIGALSVAIAAVSYFVISFYRDKTEDIKLIQGTLDDHVKSARLINQRFNAEEEKIKELQKDNLELYGEIALICKKLDLLDEAQAHLSVKKPEKQETKKRDQKEKAIKLINEALTQSSLSFSEIVDFLDQKKISLKKSTISVYLSNDERFESKDGKWQLKKTNESIPGA